MENGGGGRLLQRQGGYAPIVGDPGRALPDRVAVFFILSGSDYISQIVVERSEETRFFFVQRKPGIKGKSVHLFCWFALEIYCKTREIVV